MEYVTIGESCSVVSGGTPSRSKGEFWLDGTIPWIKIGNIKTKYVNEYDELITEEGLNNSSAKLLKKGTILYTIFATLGEVGILDIDACTNQAIAGITINDPRITPDFLYYYLKSKKEYVNSIGRGVAQNNINLTTLRKFEIPLIDRDKQSIIVKTLEKVEKIIDSQKKELDRYDELVKARFIEIFGDPENNNKAWKVKFLDNLCTVGSSKRIYQSEQSSEGIPFWRISDLVSKIDTGTVDSELFISKTKYAELEQAGLVPVTGDILLTSRGTLGKCYIIKDEDRFYFQDGMISWLGNYSEEITPIYLQYLFSMSGFRKQINRLQAGSTVAYLSIAMLKKLQVMVPDKTLQEQFAGFVAQIDKSKLTLCRYNVMEYKCE